MFYQPGMMFRPMQNPPTKKTLDLGVFDGAEELWQKGQLLDYTLKVADQKFRVHKFVLASVSNYFRAMFRRPMSINSKEFELKGVSAGGLSRLIKFIYTGDKKLIKSNPKELLECAVYFQMPVLIQQCKESLMRKLSATNCMDYLATFEMFSMNEEAQKVKDYIESNIESVKIQTKPGDLCLEWVQMMIDNWKRPEWEMFQYIMSWINADFASRKNVLNDLMSQVRFCLMTPQEIAGIMMMWEYKHAEGAWKQLVDQAALYHRQPIQLQVSDPSVQSKVRYGKSPVVISTGPNSANTSHSYVLDKDQKKRNIWKKCDEIKPPEGPGKLAFVIEVNNFLIACTEFNAMQRWNIFDPRNMTWSNMPSMRRPKDEFAMVYHNRRLYVLGGARLSWSNQKYVTDTIDEYSFQTNGWSSGGKLPVALKNHAACIVNGSIYISGGDLASGQGTSSSARLDCLDLHSGAWSQKAAMPKAKSKHKMNVMTISGHEVIVVIDQNLQITYYYLSEDEWSTRKFAFCKHYSGAEKEDTEDAAVKDIERLMFGSDSMMLMSGNSVFLLNLSEQSDMDDDDYKYWDYELLGDIDYSENSYICVKWKIKADDFKVCQFAMKDFPIRPRPQTDSVNVIGAMLAIPEKADAGVLTREGAGRGPQQNSTDSRGPGSGHHSGRGKSVSGRGSSQPQNGASRSGRDGSQPKNAASRSARGRSQPQNGASRSGRDGSQPLNGESRSGRDRSQPLNGASRSGRGGSQPQNGASRSGRGGSRHGRGGSHQGWGEGEYY